MGIAVDYIHRINPTALKAADVVAVSRYLSYPSTLGKVIGYDEYLELTNAGLQVVLNWEWVARDWAGGGMIGAQHASEAVRQARLLGYPQGDCVIGSCDYDVQNVAEIVAYASAFRDVVHGAGYTVGVYGPTNVIDWCAANGFDVFWQSMSTGFTAGRNATLNPHTDWWQQGSITIAGQQCDKNTIIRSISSGGQTMSMIATDGTKYYLCDGVTSREIDPAHIPDILYVAAQGLCTLAHGTPGADWKTRDVRGGWSAAVFGAVTTTPAPTPPVDVAALAAGLETWFAAHPPVDVLTASDFHHALANVSAALVAP